MNNKKNLFKRIRKFQKICWDIDKQSDEYKNNIFNWESIYVTRKISIWITYFLRNTKVTPNQITALWFFLGILGACLLIYNDYTISLLALVLLYFSWILDNVDGELARYKKQFSIEGNFLDMLGHQVVIPMVFCCLTFSMIIQGENPILIFLGLLATTLVTPLTKMQENVWLLLSIKALAHGDKFDNCQKPQPITGKEKKTFRKLIITFVAMFFTHRGIFYLLIFTVLFDLTKIYLVFYGIGIPVVFIPRYLGRARELKTIAKDPYLLKNQFSPEWLDF